MQRLTLTITPAEWTALCRSAEYNLRDPKREARHILKSALGLAGETAKPETTKHNHAVAFQSDAGAVVATQ